MFDLYLDYKGHQLHVTGDISPEEPSHWSEWDGGYPGCPASIEDVAIKVVLGKREREINEPSNPTKEQEKAWGGFFSDIESDVFEALDDY